MMKKSFWLLLLWLPIVLSSTVIISTPTPYNSTDSRNYAIFAAVSYCPRKCVETWSCQAGSSITSFGEITYIINNLTQNVAYIGYDSAKNKIVVVFRGSSNLANWISDFIFVQKSYNCTGCYIHKGFLSNYLAIESQVNAKVQTLVNKYPTASILSIGHSLGAALSEIAGIRLKAKFNKQVDVHHFGGPRVGNAAMAKYIWSNVNSLYRVVHYKDIIPQLPPQIFGYRHSAYEVLYDQTFSSYVVCNISGEDQNCSNKFAINYTYNDHLTYFVDLNKPKC